MQKGGWIIGKNDEGNENTATLIYDHVLFLRTNIRIVDKNI